MYKAGGAAQKNQFTRLQAAEYLAQQLPIKTAEQWLTYLNDNARDKHAKKIPYVKHGVASMYTAHTLSAFVEDKNQTLLAQYGHLMQQQPQQVETLSLVDFNAQHYQAAYYFDEQQRTEVIELSFGEQQRYLLKLKLEQAQQLIQQLKQLHPALV